MLGPSEVEWGEVEYGGVERSRVNSYFYKGFVIKAVSVSDLR